MTIARGIIPALVTPFDARDRVDERAVGALIDFLVKQGVDGIYVGGSTGEAVLQSAEERALCLRIVADATAGRLPLIAHVGAISTAEVIRLAEVATKCGYQAISAVPPYYYSFTRDEIFSHYQAIAEASSLPLVLYNFPAITKGLGTDDIIRLLGHPNIIGVKHTSSDFFALERMRQARPDAVIYNGSDEMCLAGFATGAQGAIGTTYNFMGDLFVALSGAAATGDLRAARRYQALANGIIVAIIELGVIPSTKAILGLMGIEVGTARRPFRHLSDNEIRRLSAVIAPLDQWRDHRELTVG